MDDMISQLFTPNHVIHSKLTNFLRWANTDPTHRQGCSRARAHRGDALVLFSVGLNRNRPEFIILTHLVTLRVLLQFVN